MACDTLVAKTVHTTGGTAVSSIPWRRSALAIAATTHTDSLWDPDARNWWSTWLNMAGSVAFGISAIAAYVVPDTTDPLSSQWVNLGTFIGAICFMVAALLVKPHIKGPRSAHPELVQPRKS